MIGTPFCAVMLKDANLAMSLVTMMSLTLAPGPDANTEYHCEAFVTSFDLPKSFTTMLDRAFSNRARIGNRDV